MICLWKPYLNMYLLVSSVIVPTCSKPTFMVKTCAMPIIIFWLRIMNCDVGYSQCGDEFCIQMVPCPCPKELPVSCGIPFM